MSRKGDTISREALRNWLKVQCKKSNGLIKSIYCCVLAYVSLMPADDTAENLRQELKDEKSLSRGLKLELEQARRELDVFNGGNK